MQIVRIYSHRDSPPSAELVDSLIEMGFEETAVLAALKKTGNNKASACDWLCENRSASVIELREGLAPDSPILKVILEMPQVQMTLNNPKTFLGRLKCHMANPSYNPLFNDPHAVYYYNPSKFPFIFLQLFWPYWKTRTRYACGVAIMIPRLSSHISCKSTTRRSM